MVNKSALTHCGDTLFSVSLDGCARLDVGRPFGLAILTGLIASVVCASALAQQAPDAGSLLRQQVPEPVARPRPPSPQSEPAAPPAPSDTSLLPEFSLEVKGFQLRGVTLLPLPELQTIVDVGVGQRMGLAQLQALGQRLADEYQRRGFLARVVLPPQDVTGGVVEFQVVEGRLAGVDLQPVDTPRLRRELVAALASGDLPAGAPVRPKALERVAQLLGDLPGVAASTTLVPGREPGELRLQVRYEDRPLLSGAVQLDNFGVQATGLNRVNAELNLNNPTGRGDQLSLTVLASEGTRTARAQYTTSLGGSGLRGLVQASGLDYELGEPFKNVEGHGQARVWGLGLQYPLLRTQARNVIANLGWERRRLQNSALGQQTDDRALDVVTFGLAGDALDNLGDWGQLRWSLALVSGGVDLSANAADLARDQAGPDRQGQFSKLTWAVGRQQQLGAKTEAFLQVSGQFASKNLDPGEKLGLGGPGGVRGYPALEASGDSVAVLTAELRYRLADSWRLGIFYDHGQVQLQRNPWTGWNGGNPGLPNRYELRGAGLNLVWSPPEQWSVRATLAFPLGENPGRDASGNDADGRQSNLRGWLVATALF
ncbi:MAG: ShlB/FhaC/HecB family hemolysin secretion/activation protein [Betaproteobacteria bacterium]